MAVIIIIAIALRTIVKNHGLCSEGSLCDTPNVCNFKQYTFIDVLYRESMQKSALSTCLVLLLFTGSFMAISITFSTTSAYSTTTTNANSSLHTKKYQPKLRVSFLIK